MATYADLKARIIRETNRDDLEDDHSQTLIEHINDAVTEFSDRRFWFNQSIQSVSTVEGVGSVNVPGALRIVDRVAGPCWDLTPVILNDMPDFGTLDHSGAPTKYAYYDGTLRFDLIPDAVYPLTVYGIAQAAALSADADSNIWTNEGQALIAAQTRMTLYRDVFFDPRQQQAAQAVQANLDKLIRETERRIRTRPVARLVAPNGRPVRRAYLDRM